ncbi:MAG TPA: UPF0182 family protein [Bacillota bacterium]|nr:UPF0182 family protein [Bacillota bacterium]
MNMNASPEQLERFKKISKRISILFVIVVTGFIIGAPTFRAFIDYIWMKSLDFDGVFSTIFITKLILVGIGFVLFFVCTIFTGRWIYQALTSNFQVTQAFPPLTNKKTSYSVILILSLIVGIFGSAIVQGIGWEPTLKLFNHASFGKTDPYFNMDVSFYVFILPFVHFVLYLLVGLAIFYLFIQIGAYSIYNMYRINRRAQLHLGFTVAVIGILLAGIHFASAFTTVLTNQVNIFQKSVVHGLSYTDKLINIPKAYVLTAVAIICTVWLIVLLLRGNIEKVVIPIGVYIAFVILGQLASLGVQNFIVSPNEFSKEKEFLAHNLEFTRAAYGVDDIKEEEHPGNSSLSEELVEANELTLNNVRLNDSRPLLDIYNQLQTFRTYYKFNDMDIDRYKIDGKYEQVFVGARELSTDDLPDQAKTWVNRKLRYTHGYGVAMSHVNKVTNQGQPEYMIKNLPPEGVLDVTRPQIYFGEEDYPNVIVNSKVDEFDYPTGDENATNRYEEKSGIPLQGINKILFALNQGSFRMIVSDQLTKESQLLDTRNIMDRVNRIAPFFDYDSDPYIVVRDDGTLVWLIDAYLSAENYPYSEAHSGDTNYIRNSVKVSIDAYSGEVDFYVADEEDPLLQTYKNIFPDLFTEDIPEDIKEHFRYPTKMFKVQAKMYGTYHMSNLEVFYNREDFWEFPTEKYFNKDIEMEPYYITMKLPDKDEEEFVLMMPYTPKKRQNMIAWMGVRNDGDNYGEMIVYRFPKQRNIYGPQQIENRINQDSYISQQLNLWSQGGSEVIRGNLLAIPIEDTVLYVEPVYIESSNETSLPEVKQVVMAYGEYIVMEETFDKALDKILELVESGAEPPSLDADEENVSEEDLPDDGDILDDDQEQEEQPEQPETPDEPILDADERLSELSNMFEAYQDALSEGDYEKAGKILKDIESQLGE